MAPRAARTARTTSRTRLPRQRGRPPPLARTRISTPPSPTAPSRPSSSAQLPARRTRIRRSRPPAEATVYLGDAARVPYGTKSGEVVTQYSLRNARFLVRQDIRMLVVACNTASAVALPALSKELSVPVLGVVEPGARAAAAKSA